MAETQSFQDNRGAFSRLFCDLDLAQCLGSRHIQQINHSRTSTIGALRGLHFQYAPFAELKLVRCIKGRVWDVAVDLRKNSKTFLEWHAQELSKVNAQMLVIPEGFAHGFQVLEHDSELLYLHTERYTPGAEGGLRFDDPALNIYWPLPAQDLSDRDKKHPLISQNFHGLSI